MKSNRTSIIKSTTKTTKMKLLLIAAPLFFGSFIYGQDGDNLVENGSFETVTGKVKGLGQIEAATGWVAGSKAKADLFLSETKVLTIGKTNSFGKEDPKEGSNYAGITIYSHGDKAARSYLSSKLTTPLKKGMHYCVTFWVSLAEMSKYATNQIGLNVSKSSIATGDDVKGISAEPQVLDYNNKIFNATFGWSKVCAVFVAQGGEKYITIGNFAKNDAVKTERNKLTNDMKGTPLASGYYFIDDISLKLITEDKDCDCSIPVETSTVTSTIYQKVVTVNDKMTPQQKIDAQLMFYAHGKDKFTAQGQASLDLILKEMQANPTVKITVTGYTDKSEVELAGVKVVYSELGKKRAEAVKSYLATKGIDKARVTTVDGGDSDNKKEGKDTDEEDIKFAKNRRVTFKAI